MPLFVCVRSVVRRQLALLRPNICACTRCRGKTSERVFQWIWRGSRLRTVLPALMFWFFVFQEFCPDHAVHPLVCSVSSLLTGAVFHVRLFQPEVATSISSVSIRMVKLFYSSVAHYPPKLLTSSEHWTTSLYNTYVHTSFFWPWRRLSANTYSFCISMAPSASDIVAFIVSAPFLEIWKR